MRWLICLLLIVGFTTGAQAQSPSDAVSFQAGEGSLRISIGGQEIAEYVFGDDQIRRPYFRHLRTPRGTLVTRHSPPRAGDAADHDTMHPGLWLAFGDISGADFWRNKGVVKHNGFLKDPQAGPQQGSFTVRNTYQAGATTICTEECAITVSARTDGYLLDWVSEFRPADSNCVFGDQEEMGLGVRVATPLAVVNGGEISDNRGRQNGKEVWGQQAEWCQYGGVIEGRPVGIVLMPDRANFQPSWFHARDYGLVVANPFGRRAFTKGAPSRVVVANGETLRLRFGVLVYDYPAAAGGELPSRIAAAYQAFTLGKPPAP